MKHFTHILIAVMMLTGCSESKQDVNPDDIPVIEAVYDGRLDIIEKHLANGALVNKKHDDQSSNTLLHIAAQSNQEEIVKFLLENGADLNIRNADSNTPLHLAVARDHFEITFILVAAGAEIDTKGTGGWTSLHLAAYMGHVDIANHLVSHKGADLHIRDDGGSTALHCAALKGHDTIIKLLFLKDAEINALDKEKLTPLDAAIIGGNKESEKLIRRLGGKTFDELAEDFLSEIKA